MSHARVFVPQEAVESWLSQGRADLASDVLTFEGRRFLAQPGVRFLAEVAGGQDEQRLIGRVQSSLQLEELGAEHSHEAVLLGDNAYQVAEGYLLTLDPDFARAPDVMARLAALFA
ncbi:MAG TPA: hypothetical protein VFX59_12465 [Polyangiales bacterium]|nr:hypothetical protein [Polyangiales bacterium]